MIPRTVLSQTSRALALIVALYFLVLAGPGEAAVVAFPGAEGFGSTTIGGRGGRVIYVTNLNDSGTGSLRDCLAATGPRYCLLRVAGTISLQNDLVVSNPFVTIAGQTAPGEGLQIKGGHLDIRTHDVVVRYMKFRAGDEINGSNNGDRNSVFLNGLKGEVYNVIIDHSTMIWGPDTGGVEMVENVHDVTVQWSINGEGLYFSNHYEGSRSSGHSKGVRIARNNSIWPKRITLHHNLITTSAARNPLLRDGENLDIVNNVVYNFGGGEQGGNPRSLNLIKNLFIPGPKTNTSVAYQPSTGGSVSTLFESAVFEQGNAAEGTMTIRGGPASVYTATRFSPYSLSSEQTPQEAYNAIVQNVGAARPVRDSDDRRIISNLANRSSVTPQGTSGFVSGVNYGLVWPTLASGTPYPDSDADGMDDNWEQQHFGNTSRGSASSSSSDFDADGYTDLEEYLNNTDPKVAGGGTSQDTTPPSVTITAPSTGTTVSGTVSVSATASDNVAVAGVQFKLDGGNLGAEDTSFPYSVSWDTILTPNGTHTLVATARDASGNTKTSSSVTVTVSNAGSTTSSADLNADGRVDVIDLGILLSAWGQTTKPKADINQDGRVDVVDLGILLSKWGG